ncbi:MAG TPA: polyprenyl synthetase family protein [Dehalococcoidia bacterium]|nr:polyprenyl synthetase family protein [Dehalococcoidia bacterium]
MIQLESIYGMVSADLARVEAELTRVIQVDNPLLAELLEYSVKGSGKRIRPVFTLLSGEFDQYNPKKLIPMAAGLELLHSATLVHDDIVDNSPLRRGKPTISKKWGTNAALLLGDYLFAKAGSLVASTGNLRVIRLFAQTLMTISSGELSQINVPFDTKKLRDHYFKWIGAKTACLFSTSTESGAVLSGASEETISALRDYGYYFGMTFQVIDDILDFMGKEAELGKAVGSDLSEGVVTLPAVLFAEKEEGSALIREIVDNHNKNDINEVIEKIRHSPVIDECRAIAEGFSSKAAGCLNKLPENEAREALSNLLEYMLKRNK